MTASQNTTTLSLPQLNSSSEFFPLSPVATGEQEKRGTTRISCAPLPANGLHFGIDTLHLSLSVAWSKDQEIFRLLDQQKKDLQGTSFDRCIFMGGTESGILRLNIHRLGKKYFPYHLSTADINVFLSSRTSDSSIPNCSIQIGSITSQQSLKYTYLQLLRWLAYLGGNVQKEVVTRIDLACDCLGVPLSALDIHSQDSIVTKANHFAAFWENRKQTGIQIGKSSITCRIYDKIQEMKSNVSEHKETFFRELWQYDGPNVTRVEFQLRREALREMSDEGSFEEIEAILNRIWRYLTEEWLELKARPLTDSERNSGHQHRVPASEIWRSIRNYNDSRVVKRNRLQRHINVTALRQQIRGCMVTLLAASGQMVDDFFGLLGTATQLITSDLAEYMTDRSAEFEQKYLTRSALCFVGF